VTQQFRLYRIRAGRMDAFLDAWRHGVRPLRRAFGYTFDGAWVMRDEDRFAWIVGYDGPLSWEDAEARYYGSPERAALDPDPASFIEDPQTWWVDPVDADGA
jgi:hypothetical protein